MKNAYIVEGGKKSGLRPCNYYIVEKKMQKKGVSKLLGVIREQFTRYKK